MPKKAQHTIPALFPVKSRAVQRLPLHNSQVTSPVSSPTHTFDTSWFPYSTTDPLKPFPHRQEHPAGAQGSPGGPKFGICQFEEAQNYCRYQHPSGYQEYTTGVLDTTASTVPDLSTDFSACYEPSSTHYYAHDSFDTSGNLPGQHETIVPGQLVQDDTQANQLDQLLTALQQVKPWGSLQSVFESKPRTFDGVSQHPPLQAKPGAFDGGSNLFNTTLGRSLLKVNKKKPSEFEPELDFGFDFENDLDSHVSNKRTFLSSSPVRDNPIAQMMGDYSDGFEEQNQLATFNQVKSLLVTLKLKPRSTDIDPAVLQQLRDVPSSRTRKKELLYTALGFDLSSQQLYNQTPGNLGPDLSKPSSLPRSKTGCWTCRVRKKKCSEQRPNCNECIKLGLKCAGYSVNKPEFMASPVKQRQKISEIKLHTMKCRHFRHK